MVVEAENLTVGADAVIKVSDRITAGRSVPLGIVRNCLRLHANSILAIGETYVKK